MGENGEDESEGRFEGMCDLPEPSGGVLDKDRCPQANPPGDRDEMRR